MITSIMILMSTLIFFLPDNRSPKIFKMWKTGRTNEKGANGAFFKILAISFGVGQNLAITVT